MIKIEVKPLSVNKVWQGKRFKTEHYKSYEKYVLLLLPTIYIPTPPFKIHLEFGFANKLSDLDNPVKPFLDILQKKYNINDKDIYELNIKKTIVQKNKEYIKFSIFSL